MKKLSLILFTALFFNQIGGQNLVGLKKDDAMKAIKTNYPGFVQDNSSVNHTYKYLKYIDKFNDQTLLVFLTDDDVCSSTKLMSDYSNLPAVRKDLNSKYKSKGKDTWLFTANGEDFVITLKKEEWYFTVFTSKKIKK